MKSSVDELLISNQWMMPLQGAIAWQEGGQFLYFKLPTDVTQQLKAGGEELAKVQKEKNQELTIENDIEEEESDTSGSDEELEVGVEKNGGINNEGVIQSAEVGNKGVGDTIDIVTSSDQGRHTGVNSTRVSTQNSKDIKGVGIERKKQTVIVFNSKEAAKVIQQFPNLKPKEKEMNMDWKSKTQPVLVNSKIPGLLTQWKAPFEDHIPAKRRRGKLTLTIVNPTRETLQLPKTVQITDHKKVRFVKKKGSK